MNVARSRRREIAKKSRAAGARPRDVERGFSLVIALVLLSVFGLLLAASARSLYASCRATKFVSAAARAELALDAGLTAAEAKLRDCGKAETAFAFAGKLGDTGYEARCSPDGANRCAVEVVVTSLGSTPESGACPPPRLLAVFARAVPAGKPTGWRLVSYRYAAGE